MTMFLGFSCPHCGSLDSCGHGTAHRCAVCGYEWDLSRGEYPRQTARKSARKRRNPTNPVLIRLPVPAAA